MLSVLVAEDSMQSEFTQIGTRFPEVEFRFCAVDEVSSAIDQNVNVLVAADLPVSGPQLAGLQWIHLLSAGYDHLLGCPLPKPDLIVTNSSGAYSTGIAEFVLMRLLMHAKKAEAIATAQRDRAWRRFQVAGTMLESKRVLVIGNGSIGQEVARLCRALGMVTEVSSRADQDRLGEMVADADYIVVAAALNDTSRGMLDAPIFARMRRRPYLVNISRGAIIDAPALIEALQRELITGAALDVFDQEPLPSDSPLYRLPAVSISPHVSGVFEDLEVKLVDVFCCNLTAFLNGEFLPNRIELG